MHPYSATLDSAKVSSIGLVLGRVMSLGTNSQLGMLAIVEASNNTQNLFISALRVG